MISWLWLIPAVMGGAVLGMVCAAIFAANNYEPNEYDTKEE